MQFREIPSVKSYFDQFQIRQFPWTAERAVMLERFEEFLPALVVRALFESPAWPAALDEKSGC